MRSASAAAAIHSISERPTNSYQLCLPFYSWGNFRINCPGYVFQRFYPYRIKEEFWAYWSRYIWINRYAPIPSELYELLLELTKGKDYFVITTNVDHCFQRAGFDKLNIEKKDIEQYLSEVKEAVRKDRYPLGRNAKRQDNINLFLDYVIDEAESKEIIMKLSIGNMG